MNQRPMLACAFSLALLVGCGDAEGGDGAVEILPHQSPVGLGQLWPLGDAEANPGDPERVPFEFVLLLQSNGGLEIDEVCLIGSDQFAVEGPVPSTPKRDEDAAVRITYERTDVGGPDQAALIVQSNAENFPTLVVPVCAQVVADGSPRGAVECQSPVTVPAGEKQADLCN